MKPVMLLIAALAAPLIAQVQAPQPAQVLFETATKFETAGQVEQAKTVFLTLASVYTGSSQTETAKIELGAICLFREAQSQVQAGQIQTAYDSFRSLQRIYPESPLAKLADARSRSLGIPPDPRR